MFLSLLAKYGKKLLGALIVVAIVVAVFILNPWNMFGDGLKLHHTANNITAIRKIGELITAEYYGEVISTIDQSRLRMIYADDVNVQADLIYRQIKQDLLSVYANEMEAETETVKEGFWSFKWFRKAKKERTETLKEIDKVFQVNSDIANDSLYTPIIEYLWMYKTNSVKKDNKPLKSKEEQNALWLLYQDVQYYAENLSDNEFDKYMRDGLPEHNNRVFSDYYYQKKRMSFSNKEEKKELSMIGRGWVKAGFNFEKLDESNFLFDEDEGIVHIFGVHAEILNADINPWFIPEKKIPGFQIIESNRHVDFHDAVKVKSYCIEKLRKMALDAGILEQAEIQGKEAIKSFISLVSEVEVNEVYFHYDVFSVYTKEILADKFISFSESLMLDTLIENQIDSIIKLDTAKTDYLAKQKIKEVKLNQLQMAIKQMKMCWFEERGLFYDRLVPLVYKITADSILTHAELAELKTQRWSLQNTLYNEKSKDYLKNTVWFNNELEFINEYNSAIANCERRIKYFADRKDTIFSTEAELGTFISSQKIDATQILVNRKYSSGVVLTYIDSIYNSTALINNSYPVQVAYDWQEQLYEKNNISSAEGVKATRNSDTLKIGGKLLAQIEVDTNLYADYSRISVSRNDDKQWTLSDSIALEKDQKEYLEYLITYYKINKPYGFFTKANRRMKEIVDHENMQKRAVQFKKDFQSVFNN